MDKDFLIREIMYHDDNNIKGFFGEYRWLSNMILVDIEYMGIKYPSTENAYQASKFKDIEEKEKISLMTPSESKRYANKNKKRWYSNWDNLKIGVMYDVLKIKFSKYDFKEALDDTDNKYLEETNYWKDTFWGVCENVGSNNLGKLLMDIRNINRGKEPIYNIYKNNKENDLDLLFGKDFEDSDFEDEFYF